MPSNVGRGLSSAVSADAGFGYGSMSESCFGFLLLPMYGSSGRLSPSNARAQGFSDAGGRHSSVAGGSGSFLLHVGMVLAVSGVFSSSSVPVLSSRMMSVSFHIPIPGPVAGMAPWSMPGSGSGRAFASGKAEAQGSPTCAGWVWLTASGMVVE